MLRKLLPHERKTPMNDVNLEIAKKAQAAHAFRCVDIIDEFLVLDGYLNVSGTEYEETRRTVAGPKTVRIKGFHLDISTPEGDVLDVGDYPTIFEALKEAASLVARDRIDRIAENAGIDRYMEEQKQIEEFLKENPEYLHRR